MARTIFATKAISCAVDDDGAGGYSVHVTVPGLEEDWTARIIGTGGYSARPLTADRAAYRGLMIMCGELHAAVTGVRKYADLSPAMGHERDITALRWAIQTATGDVTATQAAEPHVAFTRHEAVA